jgi:DedD protein
MDRKLKERLVGAGVLVAIGVWLIPWVLDGPPPVRDTGDEVATLALPVPVPVPVPGQSEPVRRETIELEAPRRSAPEPDAPVPVSRDETASAATETAAPAPQSAPAATPVTGAAPPPPARAATATSAPKTAAATPPSADGWMVQLGSFGDESNAQRLADRVKSVGQEARIYPFTAGGRTMYRVRVGSFPTRNRAEATASALSAHGFPAQIVNPE